MLSTLAIACDYTDLLHIEMVYYPSHLFSSWLFMVKLKVRENAKKESVKIENKVIVFDTFCALLPSGLKP